MATLPLSHYTYLFSEATASVIVSLMVYVYRHNLSRVGRRVQRWFGHQTIRESLLESHAIHDALLELRVNMFADRVGLYLFHNGGEFSNKRPQFKVACAEQICGPGVEHNHTFENPILVSRLLDLVGPMFEVAEVAHGVHTIPASVAGDRTFYTLSVANMDNGFSRHMLETNGVHTSMLCPVIDRHGQPFGFVKVDFCTFGRASGLTDLPCRKDPSVSCHSREDCQCVHCIKEAAFHIEQRLRQRPH